MASPVLPADFATCVPSSSGSLCDNFKDALLKLPVLIARFITWMIHTDGLFTTAFKKMLSDVTVKTGMIVPSATLLGANDEYLLCNGENVSRTTYADLFTAIGTAFGAGDGVNSFTLPDLRGRFPCMVGNFQPSGTAVALAGTGGVDENTLAEANLPLITVRINANAGTDGVFNSSSATGTEVNGVGVGAVEGAANREAFEGTIGQETPTKVSNLPPFLGLYFYIKT